MNHVIIGCGGVGSWLATVLSKTENKILLVDGDTLEKKNLDRQLFSPEDIGKNKAEALSRRLGPNTTFRPEYFIDGPDWGSHPGAFYWCCVDNNRGRREVLACCDRVYSPAIIMANETYSAEAYIYDPDWAKSKRDPRVYYPELLQDAGIDPLAAAVGCTGEALKTNPQLATANFMAASLGLHLWTMYKFIFREIDAAHQEATLNGAPFKLNSAITDLTTTRYEP